MERCVALARAAGHRRAVLWTQPSMTAAHPLYERLGSVPAPGRDLTGPTGRRALVYELAL
jgi:hypothetical protein